MSDKKLLLEPFEIESLNIESLNVEELEQRLEMTLGVPVETGWICGCDNKTCDCYGYTCTPNCGCYDYVCETYCVDCGPDCGGYCETLF